MMAFQRHYSAQRGPVSVRAGPVCVRRIYQCWKYWATLLHIILHSLLKIHVCCGHKWWNAGQNAMF